MKWGLWLILVNSWCICLSQTTIGVIDFDGSSNYIGYTISGTADSTNTTYSNGNVGFSGDGLEVKNTSAILTSNSINTTSFSNISLQFKLASLSDISAGGGSDVGDSVTLWISLDNGSTWSAEIKVSGRSNARWSYSSGLAIGSFGFDGNGSVAQFEPSGGGNRTSDGYSLIRLNSIPSVANLRFRISLKNGTSNEIWAIDNIVLIGTSGNCTPASSVSAASTTSHSFSLGAKWTNSSCYDEVVVFMNETSGIQVSPSGTYGAYTGNSVYSSANQCVYNGVGDSIRVTGLDNGTTYYFEIFSRRNSTWSSGVEVSGTPDFNGITFSALNTPITIDFDNTLTGCNNGAFNGSGFSPSPSTGQLNSNSWSVTGFSDGDCGFDSTMTSGDFARGSSNGGVGTGGIYAFEVASNDFALGVQPIIADFTPGEFILRLANETGSTVTSVLLSYDIYINNDQGKSNYLNLAYSVDGGSYNTLSALNCTSQQGGNTSWKKNSRLVNISNLSFVDNSYIYLKWIGDESAGSGTMDEFTLDNIKISLHTGTPSSPSMSASDSLESLKVDNISLSLASSVITDSILLNNSILSIGNYNLTLIKDTFTGDNSSFIETNGTGVVSKLIPNTGSFTYPVGNGAFSPISLKFTALGSAGSASVLVENNVYSAVSASTSTNDYIERYWSVNQSGISSFTCDVKTIYDDGDIVGSEGNLFMGKWDGSTITVGNSVNSTDNELTIDGITSFSDFTGAGSPLLPVEWLYFKGERKGEFDVLEWATASEFNVEKFVIERSYENEYYWEVYEELSFGNSNSVQNYKTQIPAKNRQMYYRIKSIDFDGKEDIYQTISIGELAGLKVKHMADLIYFVNESSQPILLQIIDLYGVKVVDVQIFSTFKLSKSELRSGAYILATCNADETYLNCEKFILF